MTWNHPLMEDVQPDLVFYYNREAVSFSNHSYGVMGAVHHLDIR
ncbi:hypothetical protein [Paenibacillus sp. ACRRX]|nr:hypothetical protein [Paenibacillus sp. ACRRX]MDK8183497.1 hypothetical protein [Paenibacillus sp. UMB4589-SE434]